MCQKHISKNVFAICKFDPCHYFSSPGLNQDAILKTRNVELEWITDIDIYHFIEKKYERWSKLYNTDLTFNI